MARLIRCKKCGKPMSVHGSEIIHCTQEMLVIQVECFRCKRENIIETKNWRVK